MTDTEKEGKEIMWKMISDIKQKRVGRRAGALALALLLAAVAPELSGLADSNQMPELEAGRVCSLKVTMTYTDPNVETDAVKPISDSEVKVAQIAALTVTGGSAEYTLLDAYKETGIELEGMNAEQSNEAAGVLLPLARQQQAANGADAGSNASETVGAESIRQGTTGADGTAFTTWKQVCIWYFRSRVQTAEAGWMILPAF